MAFDPGSETASELYQPIQAVAATYGDADGKYASWLNTKSEGAYVKDAAFFWNQPLGDSGVQQLAYVTYQGSQGAATLTGGAQPTGGVNAAGVPTPGGEPASGAAAAPSGSAAPPKSGASHVAAAPVLAVGALSVIALLL